MRSDRRACLVIDHSKYFRDLLEVDAVNRTATVQRACPGSPECRAEKIRLVVSGRCLDQRPATLGAWQVINSCGSAPSCTATWFINCWCHRVLIGRLASGVRTVRSAGPRPTTGRAPASTRGHASRRHRGELAEGVAAVAGYNLDIFIPERAPYTRDGSVKPGDLLIGSEGTLACTRVCSATRAAAANQGTGVVNFRPSTLRCSRSAHVRLQPTR